jgi:hypothetical protein
MSAFVIGMYDIWDERWREAYRAKNYSFGGKAQRDDCRPAQLSVGGAGRQASLPHRRRNVRISFDERCPRLVQRSRVRTPEETSTVWRKTGFDRCRELAKIICER